MNSRVHYVFLYAISPLLGIFVALKNVEKSNVVFFSVLTMATFGLLYHYGGSGDGSLHYTYARDLYQNVGLVEFLRESLNIIQQNPSGPVDLYIHFLYFFSGSVLQWPESLHLWAGIILGYIIGKTLQLLEYDTKGENKTNLVFIIVLIGIHFVFPLNAIRIGTAMWIALYGIVGYAKTRSIKYVFILLLAIPIHLAYALIVVPVLACLMLKRFKLLVVGLFVLSFGFQISNFNAYQYLPKTETVERKAGYIMKEEARQDLQQLNTQKKSNLNIYAAMGSTIYQQFGIFILMLVFTPLYLKTPVSNPVSFVMTVVLLTYAFSNVVVFMPSLVGRAQNLATVSFLVAGFMWKMTEIRRLVSQWYANLLKLSHYYLLAASFLYFLVSISHVLDTTSIYFIAIPIISEFQSADMTIREGILALFQ